MEEEKNATGTFVNQEGGRKEIGELSPTTQNAEGTKRLLQGRHLQMIAIGGTIGTGLFLKSGEMIVAAGPLGALFAYLIAGIAVFCVVMSLGEMATLFPISGSFNAYAERFVDPALGFTAGWTYCFQWIITLPVEVLSASYFMSYWFPNFAQTWVFIIIFLVILLALNLITVKGYGEIEYWLSLLKVFAIVCFIIIGIVIVFKDGDWFKTYSQPDAFSPAGPLNIFGSMVGACFAFGGTELVGITAGEAANPRKSVPRAINGTFWRIMIFYIISVFLIGMILSADTILSITSANKGSAIGKVLDSPFVLVFQQASIPGAPDIMNFIALIAVFSAGNSSIYAASRTMMALCKDGLGPAFLAKTNSAGVPVAAVLLCTVIGSLCFLGQLIPLGVADGAASSLFDWLTNLVGLTIIMTWLFVSVTHIRFRKAYLAQGYKLEDLPYRSPFGVYADYVGVVVMIIVIVLSGTGNYIFFQAPFDFSAFAANYCGLVLYPFLYFGYKIVKKDWKAVPLMEVDLQSGHIRTHDKEFEDSEKIPRNRWEKVLDLVA